MNSAAIAFLSVFLASSATSPVASTSPLLKLTFDEVSGNALDSGSAPQTDGQLVGGATRSTDTPSGSGFSLDLRNDAPFAHLLGSDAADLDGLGVMTLTTWLKLESSPTANLRLVAKQNIGPNFEGFTFNVSPSSNNGISGPDGFRLGMLLFGDGGFGFAFSDMDVNATDWVFVAATYDTSANEIAYYSGDVGTPVTQLGTTQSPATNPGVIDGLTARFGVGFTDALPAADTSVDGWQDDVRVYGSVLSIAELEAVRLANIPEPTTLALVGFAIVGVAIRRLRRIR